MKIGKDLSVFQYPIETIPELSPQDYPLLVQIFRLVREELDLILGGRAHVLAGKTIFSVEDLADNIEIACKLHGTDYTFIVNATNKTLFTGADLT
jgi:hypothetical protein